MSSVVVGKTYGVDYKWEDANFSWDSVDAQKPWEHFAQTNFTATVTEDVLAFSEKKPSEVIRGDDEVLSFAEVKSTQTIKNALETLGFAETYIDLINWLNHIHENLSLGESSPSIVTWVREVSETLSFAEVKSTQPTKINPENISFSEEQTKTFEKIVMQTIAFAETYVDLINWLNQVYETLGFAEKKPSIVTRGDDETLGFAEEQTKNIGKNILRTLTVSEALGKTFSKTVLENLSFAESYTDVITWLNQIHETLGFVEKRISLGEKESKEILGFTEAQIKQSIKNLMQTFALADSINNQVNFSRNTQENLHFAETYTDYINWLNQVYENLGFSEVKSTQPTKNNSETLGFSEEQTKNIGKNILRTLAFAEDINNQVVFLHEVFETFAIGEVPSKEIEQGIYEAFAIVEKIVRGSNAVIYDVDIRGTAKTLDEIRAIVAEIAPKGYTALQPLIPGDYIYENAIVGIQISAPVTEDQVGFYGATLHVDVPDVNDRGETVLTAAEKTINFAKTYHEPPEVAVTFRSGTTVAVPKITSITKDSFKVVLYDSTDGTTMVAGSITWQSKGY